VSLLLSVVGGEGKNSLEHKVGLNLTPSYAFGGVANTTRLGDTAQLPSPIVVIALTDSLIFSTSHSIANLAMPSPSTNRGRCRLCIATWLGYLTKDHMLREIAMRHVLLLVAVLVVLVCIDWVTPNGITDESTQVGSDPAANTDIIASNEHLLIDPVQNIVAVLKPFEEIIKLWVRNISKTCRLKACRNSELGSSDDAINIPSGTGVSFEEVQIRVQGRRSIEGLQKLWCIPSYLRMASKELIDFEQKSGRDTASAQILQQGRVVAFCELERLEQG
jgi:hypothetical protein